MTDREYLAEARELLIDELELMGIEHFAEITNKIIERFRPIISELYKAMRAPILIPQYEQEIQKLEQLLKYTKHSKKCRKHERRLKKLQAELASLYEVVENDEFK